jgi:hypothetical protein
MTHQLKLNLCVKKLDQGVNYISPNKQINLNKEEKLDFLAHSISKEVKKLPRKKAKMYVKVCKVLVATCVSTLLLGNPVWAATPGAELITPRDIWTIGKYVIGLCVAASSISAIILYQLAGGFRMFGKAKESTEWQTNIVKGYTMSLLAPVIIGTIAFIVCLLFANFQWFVKPF